MDRLKFGSIWRRLKTQQIFFGLLCRFYCFSLLHISVNENCEWPDLCVFLEEVCVITEINQRSPASGWTTEHFHRKSNLHTQFFFQPQKNRTPQQWLTYAEDVTKIKPRRVNRLPVCHPHAKITHNAAVSCVSSNQDSGPGRLFLGLYLLISLLIVSHISALMQVQTVNIFDGGCWWVMNTLVSLCADQ